MLKQGALGAWHATLKAAPRLRGVVSQVPMPALIQAQPSKTVGHVGPLGPGLFDAQKVMAAKDLYEFDDVFTAPLHGFKNTDDYWHKASALQHMGNIAIPALALNAKNDPFIPSYSLPTPDKVSTHVTLWQPDEGGHVGFASGFLPGHLKAMPQAVGQWLLQHIPSD